MIALVVRFGLLDAAAAARFDALQAAALPAVAAEEGTHAYVPCRVPDEPLQRVVLAVYRDHRAHEVHDAAPAMAAFVDALPALTSSVDVEELDALPAVLRPRATAPSTDETAPAREARPVTDTAPAPALTDARPAAPSAPGAVDAALRHRTAEATITVLGADGAPLAHERLTLAQRRHEFLFGCIGFDFVPFANGEVATPGEPARTSIFGGSAPAGGEQALADLWLDLFNVATLPFYWGEFEPERGRPDTARLMRAARWFAERGVTVKGHPLAWHTQTAPWLAGLTTDQVIEAQRARSARETGDFAGVVDVWDAINEAVIMPEYDRYDNGLTRVARRLGRVGTVRLAFDAARAGNPGAVLLLNDFDMSPAYEHLVEECLDAGVRIDALGLQSHMHQGYWGEERTLEVLERFSRFGLPLHMTESTLVSGDLMPSSVGDLNDHQVPSWPSTPEGEERQADEVSRHYRTLLSHPSVRAVNWWGICDAGTWLRAPVGLVRADGSRKPSYDALHGLVKGAWWQEPTTVVTDADGRLRVSGWRGSYEVAGRGGAATFALDGTAVPPLVLAGASGA